MITIESLRPFAFLPPPLACLLSDMMITDWLRFLPLALLLPTSPLIVAKCEILLEAAWLFLGLLMTLKVLRRFTCIAFESFFEFDGWLPSMTIGCDSAITL